MFCGDLVLEVGEVEGVASIFLFDTFADSDDLVCWRLVLKFLCCGFLCRSVGGSIGLLITMIVSLDGYMSTKV